MANGEKENQCLARRKALKNVKLLRGEVESTYRVTGCILVLSAGREGRGSEKEGKEKGGGGGGGDSSAAFAWVHGRMCYLTVMLRGVFARRDIFEFLSLISLYFDEKELHKNYIAPFRRKGATQELYRSFSTKRSYTKVISLLFEKRLLSCKGAI